MKNGYGFSIKSNGEIEDTGRMICLMEEVSSVRMQADMKEIL